MSNYIIITFKGIEEKLSQNMFIRTHKSFLVSIHAIQSIDGNEIKMEKITLPISKNYKEEVMNKIGERLFKR